MRLPGQGPGPILGTTHLGSDGDEGLLSAADLAAATGRPLVAVHCLRPPFPYRLTAEEESAALRTGQSRLVRRLAELEIDAPVTVRVRMGSRGKVILEAAEESGASLVVLGPHRRRRRFEDVLGGTGDRVVRGSRVPCLLANRRLPLPFRRVLVPTDFSAVSLGALRCFLQWLAAIPREKATIVEVLHVQALADPGRTAVRKVDYKSFLARAVADVGQVEKVKLLPRVVSSPLVFDGILRIAEQMAAELVVMGTQGRNFVSRMLLGSVTSACLRRLPHPLLLVPPTERQEGLLAPESADGQA